MHCIQFNYNLLIFDNIKLFYCDIELQNVIIFLFWKWVSKRQKY